LKRENERDLKLLYNKDLKQHARQLRENVTDAERHLWAKIRRKQVKGYQFYQQKPIGEYIVDFYCPKVKLVIEVDGSHHLVGGMIEYDRIRDDYLSRLGLRVLRFTNAEVLKNIEGVVERILENMEKIPLSPGRKIPLNPPLRKGEGQIPLNPPLRKGENRFLTLVKGGRERFRERKSP